MKGSNSLNSHSGESSNSRADKMSGKVSFIGRMKKKFFEKSHDEHQKDGKRSMKWLKKFYSKKRRQFLNNPKNWDKI